MSNLTRWFYENPVDLAYVSMLKHDAYSVIGAGERLGFPVVLRPEGAGATGDIAWQSWGNFGRTIGRRCRRASAFVSISKAIEQELRDGISSGNDAASAVKARDHGEEESPRIVAIPNGVPVPELAWQRRLDWRGAPRAVFVGRLAAEKGLDLLVVCLAIGASQISRGPADLDRRWAPAPGAGTDGKNPGNDARTGPSGRHARRRA